MTEGAEGQRHQPDQCGNALNQWIGQDTATYTGTLDPVEGNPGDPVYVTIEIDADNVTMTGYGGAHGPHRYYFRPDEATITWGSEGQNFELSNPVCDGNGTVTTAKMRLNEAAEGTALEGQVSRVDAGPASV